MNYGKWKLIFVACTLGFLSSCNGQDKFNRKQLDSVSKDIPMNHKGLPIRPYIFKERIADILNLELLENGFDSLQIRIWHSPAYVDSLQLVVIKGVNGNWSADASNYKIIYNKNRESFDSISGLTKKVDPQSGWQIFLKKIFDLEVMTLPDMNEVNDSMIATEVGGVGVEISTKSKYRFYHYLDPSLFDDSILEAKKMGQIMQLIENEFDFKRLGQPNNKIEKPLPIKPTKMKLQEVKKNK
jgi:hypothetical protein